MTQVTRDGDAPPPLPRDHSPGEDFLRIEIDGWDNDDEEDDDPNNTEFQNQGEEEGNEQDEEQEGLSLSETTTSPAQAKPRVNRDRRTLSLSESITSLAQAMSRFEAQPTNVGKQSLQHLQNLSVGTQLDDGPILAD